MNTRFTHAHGWITPDNQCICTPASDTCAALWRHDPDLHVRFLIDHDPTFTQSLYIDGYTRVGLYRDTLLFEHGVSHAPDPELMRCWAHACSHSGLVTHDTLLYSVAGHDHPRRRRHFQQFRDTR